MIQITSIQRQTIEPVYLREGKEQSAFCSTLYTSKQRKFVPLFDSGGTFLTCACVKEISPETLRSVVF